MISHLKGRWGEEKAAEYLEHCRYRILKRNFRKALGEVDIIAVRDKKIVFFEVKNWPSGNWENLRYSIDRKKVHRFRRVSEFFLHENPEYSDFDIGFDLILLSGRTENLNHIEDFL